MSKYCKEKTMISTGKVYKFTGLFGIIRPTEWGPSRKDVLFKKAELDLKIGDKVSYEHTEHNGRRYAKNIQKLDT